MNKMQSSNSTGYQSVLGWIDELQEDLTQDLSGYLQIPIYYSQTLTFGGTAINGTYSCSIVLSKVGQTVTMFIGTAQGSGSGTAGSMTLTGTIPTAYATAVGNNSWSFPVMIRAPATGLYLSTNGAAQISTTGAVTLTIMNPGTADGSFTGGTYNSGIWFPTTLTYLSAN